MEGLLSRFCWLRCSPQLRTSPLLLCCSRTTAPKKAIVAFVEKVTKCDSLDFVLPAQRVATFDDEGTLLSEQPSPVQFYFALDRVKAPVPRHPEWEDKEPVASLLRGNLIGALAGGVSAVVLSEDRKLSARPGERSAPSAQWGLAVGHMRRLKFGSKVVQEIEEGVR